MLKFISLSSGSNGNCYYLGDEEFSLLIDVGIGGRTIKKRLLSFDIDVSKIDLVLVTHDHIDHIRYLGSFSEYYCKPVYATEILHKALSYHPCTTGKINSCKRFSYLNQSFTVKGVSITPFEVPHDATQTLGYFIDFKGVRFLFVTDLGAINDDLLRYAGMADNIIIESNYDIDMLIHGGYTPELKARILNDSGHLSNDQTAEVIKRIYHKGLKNIYLCHLSENNNTPQSATNCIRSILKQIGVDVERRVKVQALPRRSPFEELFDF